HARGGRDRHAGEGGGVVAVRVRAGERALAAAAGGAVPQAAHVAVHLGVEVGRFGDAVLRHREHEVHAGRAHEVVPDLGLRGRVVEVDTRAVLQDAEQHHRLVAGVHRYALDVVADLD